MKNLCKILVVEDDEGLRVLIQSKLKRDGFETEGEKFGKKAIEFASQNQPVLLILDYKLPDISANEVIKELKEKNTNAYYIIITGHANVKTAVEMMKLGVKDYLIKDSNFLDLLPTVVMRVIDELEKEKKLEEAKEALHRSEESYRLLAESLVDVIWMTDYELNLIYISQSVNDLLGYNLIDLMNQKINKMLTDVSSKTVHNYYNKVINDMEKKSKSNQKSIHHKNEMFELECLKKNGDTVWTEIRISFLYNSKNKIAGILGVTRDITGRKEAIKNLNESYKTLRKAFEASVEAMGKATEIRDPYTAGHQRRVSMLAYEIAKEMKLPADQCEGVRLAGAIHDIGKIYVPAEILSKPGKISDNEFNIIKTHSQVGFDILRSIEFPWPIAQIVLQHHERINGTGYPLGLKDDEILLEAKIISVADVVEAMASYRPYRPALGIDKALTEIKKGIGKIYDKKIVEICCKIIEEKGFEFV